jgi:hypothetical protein
MARTGVNTSHDWVLQVLDATPQTLTLLGVTGDPSFGEEMADQREQTDILERGIQQGATFGDEQAIEVSWQVQDCEESREFIDMVLFRGAVYGATGTAPTVTTDPLGGKSVQLKAICTPPVGTPRTVTYERTRWRCSPSGGVPSTTWTLNATCFGRSES